MGSVIGLVRHNRRQAVQAGVEQCDMIAWALDVLAAAGVVCPEHILAVARARLANSDRSAGELAKMLGLANKYVVQGRIRRLLARARDVEAGRTTGFKASPHTRRQVPDVLPPAEVERLRRLVGVA